jgi:hypothetical protein
MVPAESDNQIDLLAAAQRLRTVRTACRRFLMLWAMSPAKGSQARDSKNLPLHAVTDDPEALLRAMSDPQNHDWSLLYRGSVLDD